MKQVDFLKNEIFLSKGVYDNKLIYENTLDSFEKNINLNLGIVFNVWLTKDKKIIVFDEANLTRLLNLKDNLEDTTYDELTYLSSFHIPLLSEVLNLINNKVPLIINIKSTKHNYDIVKELVSILDGYVENIAVTSINPCYIKWINSNRPNYITGEIITKFKFKFLKYIIANFSIKTDFKLFDIKYYDEQKVKTLRKNTTVIGYNIINNKEYLTYKESFDNLIVDNIETINNN